MLVDLHYRWTYITRGLQLQVDLHYRWTYITGGLTLQEDLRCRWTYNTGGLTLQAELHCRWACIAAQVDLHCRWTYIAGGLAVLAGDADDVLVDYCGILEGAGQVGDGVRVHVPAHHITYLKLLSSF